MEQADISPARILVAGFALIGGIFFGVALALAIGYSSSDWPGVAYNSSLVAVVIVYLLWPATRRARAPKAASERP